MRQGFESNVWSNFPYVLYLRKTFFGSSRAGLSPDYFFVWQQQFCSEGNLSWTHPFGFFYYVTPWFHKKTFHWQECFYLLTFLQSSNICLILVVAVELFWVFSELSLFPYSIFRVFVLLKCFQQSPVFLW